MTEHTTSTDYEWTLANFTDTILRGGVALWAWSPTRRIAQLDSLCRVFWTTPNSVVSIEERSEKVRPEDRHGMMLDWEASATDPQHYSFDFRIGDGPDAQWIYRCPEAGVFNRVLRRMQAQADARGHLIGTFTSWTPRWCAPAGVRRTGAIGGEGAVGGVVEALGSSQGVFSTELHRPPWAAANRSRRY